MKVLVLYDYPPTPGGLSTQGDMLFRGLRELGVDVQAAHYRSSLEKEWYYRWFKPDVVTGVGYWGYTPDIILHPKEFGLLSVPWLVADGYIANYQDVLNELPLILVTSRWVKEMYVRDGVREDSIVVLPVGCETQIFHPVAMGDPKVREIRRSLGIGDDELMILTIGGDAASKGGREVMEALAGLGNKVAPWRYVCKVWPQGRTKRQNSRDRELAQRLGIGDRVSFHTSIISRNFIPYLISACDLYAAPSRLEGFGMPQIEAGACGKAVLSINAMGPRDTMEHGKTAMLAGVAREIVMKEAILGSESGFSEECKIVFDPPRIVDYRADVDDISRYLQEMMTNKSLRDNLGREARKRVVEQYDYLVVAQRYLDILKEKLELV